MCTFFETSFTTHQSVTSMCILRKIFWFLVENKATTLCLEFSCWSVFPSLENFFIQKFRIPQKFDFLLLFMKYLLLYKRKIINQFFCENFNFGIKNTTDLVTLLLMQYIVFGTAVDVFCCCFRRSCYFSPIAQPM